MIENVYSISPQQINYIVELHKSGSFHKASKVCFVTQPTLSMQVKKAEEQLGFTIFDRSTTPIELTPAGEKLLPILIGIQQEYTRIGVLKSKLEGTYIEQIKIGVIPTISAYLLTDIFDEVRKTLPDVRFRIQELKTEELIDAIKESRIDMGIMAGPFNNTGIRTIPLYHEEILLYFPQFQKKLAHPDDLIGQQPWLLSRGNCLRTQMVHFCEIHEDDDSGNIWSYEGGNVELLMKMVDLNGGYTLVPEYYNIQKDKLIRLLDEKNREYPAREIISLVQNRSYKMELIEKMIRLIQLHYGRTRKDVLRLLNWR